MITAQRSATILRLGPVFIVRESGLKVAELGAVRNFSLSKIADELAPLEMLHKQLSSKLNDELFSLINQGCNKEQSQYLLALKRSIFNSRNFDLAEAKEKVPENIYRPLSHWHHQNTDIANLRADAELIANNFLLSISPGFRDLFKQYPVRTAICYAQPDLFRTLGTLPVEGTLNKNQRRALISGLAYVFRMATKTSPFSHLSTIACGMMEANPMVSDQLGSERAVIEQHVFNVGLVKALVNHLSNELSSTNTGLPLVWNKTAIRSSEKYIVLYAPTAERTLTDIAAESISELPLNTVFLLTEDILQNQKRPLYRNELASFLSEQLPHDENRLLAAIDKMLALHLLVPVLDFEENDLDSLGALAQSEVLQQTFPEVAAQLQKIDARKAALYNLQADAKADELLEIAEQTRQLFDNSGISGVSISTQKIIHNSVYRINPQQLPAHTLKDYQQDFNKLLSVLPIFDADYPLRQWLKDQFLHNGPAVGSRMPAIEFFNQLFSKADDDDLVADQNALLNPELLNKSKHALAQNDAASAFVAELYALMNGAGAELILTDNFWEKWADSAASFQDQSLPVSATLTGQFVGGDDRSQQQFVLNKVFAGYGTMFTVPHTVTGDLDFLTTQIDKEAGPRHFSDIIATMAFQGQIRTPVSGKSLYYPGQQVRENDLEKYLAWKDLYIQWDEHGNPMLFDARIAKQIVPLHRGTLSSLYFPPFYKFLTMLGPAFTPNFPLFERLCDFDEELQTTGIRSYPRITSGRVVLMRRAWSVPSSEIPIQMAEQSNSSHYMAVRDWAASLDMPAEVFIVPMSYRDFVKSQMREVPFKRVHKPFYVNWDDYATFQLFLKYTLLDASFRISFIEALPAPDSVKSAGQYTSELLFEIYENETSS
ncbi:lantibiotic dehydratase [Pedobacter caeni]|uniref:Lantibiotic dehydratase, C terminus n=1 Tax=Pedobacter caeni TaxID=288992 RepID=A0A1M4T719_9SPHI|nr:lantibiotic dehydratase [Pedobacter caeni]SHE40259.1 Lantibiotic dehydratase, C terminus [Pedobacter caeni]